MSYESKPNHFQRNFHRTTVKSELWGISPPPHWPPTQTLAPHPLLSPESWEYFYPTSAPGLTATLVILDHTYICVSSDAWIDVWYSHLLQLFCFLHCLFFSGVFLLHIRPPWCTPCLNREFFSICFAY